MVANDDLSLAAQEVRSLDRDRFLTALFAPAEKREGLLTLYAFNLELAQVREKVSQPILGQIRLQWWRDQLEFMFNDGEVGAHPVARPLADTVRRFGLARQPLDTLIDTRQQDVGDEPLPTLDALEHYAAGTAAALNVSALELLGCREEAAMEAGRHVGIAWALIGLLRAVPFHAAGGRLYLPTDLLGRHDVATADILAGRSPPRLPAVVGDVAERAAAHLAAARRRRRDIPRSALPVLLTATLADGHLGNLRRTGFDPFDPHLAARRPGPLRLIIAAAARRY